MISHDDMLLYSKFRRERVRVKDWTFRIGFELKQHARSCALTLTYSPEYLPADGGLCMRDFQLFLKRLRKRVSPVRIRFFACGEYGKLGGRPHYHCIIFGFCPDDLVYSHSDDHGIKFYRSKFIADVWGKGFIVVCRDVNPSTVPYLCKYMQKFNVLPAGLRSPFLTMSRKPGIGFCALGDPLLDFSSDAMYYRGKRLRLPRYYLEKIKTTSNADVVMILSNRKDYNICAQRIKDKRRLKSEQLHNSDVAVDAEFERYINSVKKMKNFLKK